MPRLDRWLVASVIVFGLLYVANKAFTQDAIYRPNQIFTVNPSTQPPNCTIGSVYIRTSVPASISVCSNTDVWTDLATATILSVPNYFSVITFTADNPGDIFPNVGIWELVHTGKLLFSDDAIEVWVWRRTS